ncbi:alpha/beta fold hydrolase [Streptomyces sp. LP05-1]|uniref:Alpha/beta fold hydrolase n=1 Tax=Streptomyces pyxinae TaxID=2970734 RepID=A0ABT2CNP7_9ACTN|nr:thioesterase domain-containing protein [Streptomyces sp. LP05-1]MCS0639058.1 alpha/beta fold hydrolase [Streptomyces sp. LP05-1]
MPRSTWLRALTGTAGEPAGRLVCFPHSGGSASGFRPWVAHLPDGVRLLAVQYPGRADRVAEEPVTDVAAIGAAVAAELLAVAPEPELPYTLFGHSLGALAAYETALALRDAGRPVRRLDVSGCAAPGQVAGGLTHRAPDDALWSAVAGLGGLDREVIEDAELRELLLPALRADITAHETYRPRPGTAPLDCPVRCFHGADDPLVDGAAMAGWAAVTTGGCAVTARPGGHFYRDGTADLTGWVADGPAGVLPETAGRVRAR